MNQPRPTADSIDAEAVRIRTVYAARKRRNQYAWSQPGHLFTMQDLESRLLRALSRHHVLPLDRKEILEIGCGNGHFLRELIKWGADPERTMGIDLIDDRLERGRRLSPAGVRFEHRNAADSGLPPGSFDLILQMTVFSSILSEEMREAVASEMIRLLAPGGKIVWYDLRVDNPRNRDVRGIGKAAIRRLFPGADMTVERVTLAPPIARTLAGVSRTLCLMLTAVPLLRSHYLAVITPRPELRA